MAGCDRKALIKKAGALTFLLLPLVLMAWSLNASGEVIYYQEPTSTTTTTIIGGIYDIKSNESYINITWDKKYAGLPTTTTTLINLAPYLTGANLTPVYGNITALKANASAQGLSITWLKTNASQQETAVGLRAKTSDVNSRFNVMINSTQISSYLPIASANARFNLMINSSQIAAYDTVTGINTRLTYYPNTTMADGRYAGQAATTNNLSLKFNIWQKQPCNLHYVYSAFENGTFNCYKLPDLYTNGTGLNKISLGADAYSFALKNPGPFAGQQATTNNLSLKAGTTATTNNLSLKVNKAGDTLTGQLNTQNIWPTADNTYTLGNSTLAYSFLYISNQLYSKQHGGGWGINSYYSGGWKAFTNSQYSANINQATSGPYLNIVIWNQTASNLLPGGTASSFTFYAKSGTRQNTFAYGVDNAGDLGATDFRWKNLYVGNNVTIDGKLKLTGNFPIYARTLAVNAFYNPPTGENLEIGYTSPKLGFFQAYDRTNSVYTNLGFYGNRSQFYMASTGHLITMFNDVLFPNTDNVVDLGKASTGRFKSGYIKNAWTVGDLVMQNGMRWVEAERLTNNKTRGIYLVNTSGYVIEWIEQDGTIHTSRKIDASWAGFGATSFNFDDSYGGITTKDGSIVNYPEYGKNMLPKGYVKPVNKEITDARFNKPVQRQPYQETIMASPNDYLAQGTMAQTQEVSA